MTRRAILYFNCNEYKQTMSRTSKGVHIGQESALSNDSIGDKKIVKKFNNWLCINEFCR